MQQIQLEEMALREGLRFLADRGDISREDYAKAFIEKVDVSVSVRPDQRVINRLARKNPAVAEIIGKLGGQRVNPVAAIAPNDQPKHRGKTRAQSHQDRLRKVA